MRRILLVAIFAVLIAIGLFIDRADTLIEKGLNAQIREIDRLKFELSCERDSVR